MHHGPGVAVGILALIGGLILAIGCGALAWQANNRFANNKTLSRAASFRFPLVLSAAGVVLVVYGVRWI